MNIKNNFSSPIITMRQSMLIIIDNLQLPNNLLAQGQGIATTLTLGPQE
jgi:hypothetical protein